MAREPDVDRQPIPVIPALTRGYRIGCAILAFPILLRVCYLVAFWIAGLNFHLDDWPNFIQNFGRMIDYLYQHQILLALPFGFTIFLTLAIYDPFAKHFYKWWYSK
jgi:hypothetical protein